MQRQYILSAISTTAGTATISFGSLTVYFLLSAGAAGFQVCQIFTHASKTFEQSTLETMMGFFYNINNIASGITTTGLLNGIGPRNNFVVDTCLYMQISNILIVNNNNRISQAIFKTTLGNAVNNTILFNETTEHQFIYFNSSNHILDKLNTLLFIEQAQIYRVILN